ncbi:MAG: vitamin K epoxide reductase family protein [Bacteriovorax sp.]|nr:vitamin K epoxide reductase family protein [Bacteriovorax sp.]
MHKSTIYQDKLLNTTIILSVLSILMIGFSIYLTQHYFDLRFPTGLESKSLCNVNQFFNCDKTTLSTFGNIAGVPIALFGALIGFFILGGLLIKNEDYERSIYFTIVVNFIGCVLLFSYSLFILKGLCPFCTLYYIVSGLTLLFFYRKSKSIKPAAGYLAAFALIVLVVSGLTKMNVDSKAKAQNDIAGDTLKQFYSLANLGSPKITSEFKIAAVPNAPIQMVIFSDFECPACKALSELMPQIAARYVGKIDIQYFYYPLDNSCNPNMKNPLHQYACKAAYAASCMPPQNFATTHDEIFQNQDKFESGFLDQYIKSNKLEACVADPKTKEKVVALIAAADPFNIRSTPSYLINGVKIEGALPPAQLFAIMDELLRKSGR